MTLYFCRLSGAFLFSKGKLSIGFLCILVSLVEAQISISNGANIYLSDGSKLLYVEENTTQNIYIATEAYVYNLSEITETFPIQPTKKNTLNIKFAKKKYEEKAILVSDKVKKIELPKPKIFANSLNPNTFFTIISTKLYFAIMQNISFNHLDKAFNKKFLSNFQNIYYIKSSTKYQIKKIKFNYSKKSITRPPPTQLSTIPLPRRNA